MGIFSRLFSKPSVSPDSPPDRLDDLLRAAASDADRRTEFYRILPESTLIVPGEVGDGELFVRPYDVRGRKSLLVFSSAEKLRQGLNDLPPFVELRGRTLLEAALGFESLVLNYGAPHDKEFTRSEIESILDGSILAASCGSGDYRAVLLGQPKHYPVELMTHLQEWLPSTPEIRSAYIAQMTEEGSDEPRLVMAFETDAEENRFREVMNNVAFFADAVDAGDILLTRLADDGLGEYLRSETRPFYRAGE